MNLLYRLRQFVHYYWKARTRYQLHSPFLFGLAESVLDDRRNYYAFAMIEQLRQTMLRTDLPLQIVDWGAGRSEAPERTATIAELTRRSASSATQGRWLFRLALWLQPKSILELGASLGLGTLYLALSDKRTRVITLEGSEQTAKAAAIHFDMLDADNIEIRTGEFDETLLPALEALKTVDLVFLDGNHQYQPTLNYFETCLLHAHNETVFIFDDIHWSAEMGRAWKIIQQHPRVQLTIDLYDLGVVCIDPAFKEKQHLALAPWRWKPWQIW